MIIFGTRVREKEVGSGKFYCPKCGRERRYKRKNAAKYFALYFIPLIQIEELGQVVECQSCRQAFPPAVLKAPAASERAVTEVKRDLESGTPLHMVHRKLVNQGLDEASAAQLVKQLLGGRPNVCQKCGLMYQATVQLCANCGGALAPAE